LNIGDTIQLQRPIKSHSRESVGFAIQKNGLFSQ
jgi:hypothetical protein